MDDLQEIAPHQSATIKRPLLGMTVLAVEDSRFACEALRQLCLRSGARIRRADCLRSAHRHLKVYRPSIAIIDVGLPDGSGIELIEELATTSPRISVILASSGDASAEAAAIKAGADGFLLKPLESLTCFQQNVLEHLPKDWLPTGVRSIDNDTIDPDPIAYRDDMTHIANLLSDRGEDAVIDYATQFLEGVARSADDNQLAHAATELSETRKQGLPFVGKLTHLSRLIDERLQRRVAI